MPAEPAAAKALFLEAVALDDPAARAALLNERCGGDDDLRGRVGALLAANDRALAGAGTASFGAEARATGTFAPDAPPAPAPTTDYPSRDEHAGVVVGGKYSLVEAIGEGGMGSVWRARQTEPVKRVVAVKLIKAGMDSRQVLARFEAERQALAMMDHPNIAKVLDAGATPDGRPYFVMELVKGTPITEYSDAQKLTPKARLELFVQACHAIQHAHQKGIIHRDIKPSNVLVAIYDDKPVVKVIDFGVAKATGAALTERTIDTGFGGVVGTPQYMSPEQATFNNLDIDTRSDVYALGVLLYELLTGSPPFSKKVLEKKGLMEILRVVREEEPPRPSTNLSTSDALPSLSASRGTEPKKLTGLLRNELDWIVMKALEKDRTRRYETANGFAADVLRYLSGEAVQAHPPSRAYRVKKFVRRNKVQVIAASTVLFVLLAGIAGTTWGLIRTENQRSIAVENERKGRESERAAQLAREEADAKRGEAEEQSRRAAANEKRATQSELKANEEATNSRLLASYVNAKYMKSEGRIGPAYESIVSAIRTRPNWEYGHLLADIVSDARKYWRPVATFDANASGNTPCAFVGGDESILAMIRGSRLQLFDVTTSRKIADADVVSGPAYPIKIGDHHVGVVEAKRILIASIAKLDDLRAHKFDTDIKSVIADPAGRYLAVLMAGGEATIYGTYNWQPLATRRFSIEKLSSGTLATPTMSFSPSGKVLAYFTGLWTRPTQIWTWGENRIVDLRLPGTSMSMSFVDENRIATLTTSLSSYTMRVIDWGNPAKSPQTGLYHTRGNGNFKVWLGKNAGEAARIFASSTTQDSIELFSLNDNNPISSCRFGSLLPSLAAESRFLDFGPVSGLLALAGGNRIHVFRSTAGTASETATYSTPIRFWSMAAASESMIAAYVPDIAKPQFKLTRKPFNGAPEEVFQANWPEAAPKLAAHVWGCATTPDGNTVAVLWQENTGGGNIGSTYYRKAILVYKLDSPPDKAGRLSPVRTIWLDKFKGMDGRDNRLLVLSPDGKTVVFAAMKRDAVAYRVDDGALAYEFNIGNSMRSSPDGSRVIGGFYSKESSVRVWDTASGQVVFTSPEKGKVRTFAMSPDNRKLYVGWFGDILECFDLQSGKSISKIQCKASPIAICPNSERFVGFLPDSDTKGSTVLGDLVTGQTILVLGDSSHVLNPASFSASGDGIAFTGTRDKAVMLRSLDPDAAKRQLDKLEPFAHSISDQLARQADRIIALAGAGDMPGVDAALTTWLPSALAAWKNERVRFGTVSAPIGSALLKAKMHEPARRVLQECLAAREAVNTDAWTTFYTQSMLGEALLGQEKYAEAEPLLLKGYEGLKAREQAIPPQGGTRIPEALDRLVELYAATERPAEAARWRAERAKYPPPVAPMPREKK